ncbi:putative endonuclease 4 [Catellatospora sp. TT07R-123]|uniref:deoxyribonuclease IV n=1 Tax=Catellatospora sp. TT07R-123 TaxID=2733863 RepID=UPI001B143806|nr:deoxyribonuclease IV [Catellatospora sp. TT07R-123]GHJ44999.1 putative endonuclease 4 [Catellatospora sp. TT07R-123]
MSHGIGAHAPVAGGLAKAALPYVDAVSAGSVQVFVGNPRGWARPAGNPAQDEAFAAGCHQRAIPAYVHASLLVNIGSPTEATVEQSRETLTHGLLRAARIGAAGVVFHAGSAVDSEHAPQAFRQVREVLLPLLDALPDDGPRLLVEPSAGGGRSLAARVEDLGPYFEAVDFHPRLAVCFDTCHAWAAGHDLAKPGGMAQTLDELVAVCGEGRLALVHANDSRDTCGSLRDRHETIGRGTIGAAAFAELMRHPAVAGVPVIVETPGELHATDISLLRGLRDE